MKAHWFQYAAWLSGFKGFYASLIQGGNDPVFFEKAPIISAAVLFIPTPDIPRGEFPFRPLRDSTAPTYATPRRD